MASEHSDGESLSVLSTGSPHFKSNFARMWDVSPTTHSVKLQLIYGLKMSKLPLWTLSPFKPLLVHVHTYIACMDGGISQGGQPASRGGGQVSPCTPP